MVSAAPSHSTGKRRVPAWHAPALGGLLAALLFLVGIASLAIGTSNLTVAEALRGLLQGSGVEGLIMRDIRLPRLLLSLSIGGMLGLSGAAMQALLGGVTNLLETLRAAGVPPPAVRAVAWACLR